MNQAKLKIGLTFKQAKLEQNNELVNKLVNMMRLKLNACNIMCVYQIVICNLYLIHTPVKAT